MKKRFSIFVILVLFLLIASQIMWVNRVLERDKSRFQEELEESIEGIVKYQSSNQTYDLFSINQESFSLTLSKEKPDSIPDYAKNYGSYETNKYEQNAAISDFLEAVLAEMLFEKENLNLQVVDSLFHIDFQYASELLAYSFKTEKHNETIDSLYFGNNAIKQLEDSTKGVFITIPLGTSNTYRFVSHFVFKPSTVTRRLMGLAAMSGIAVIAVALILFVLLFQLQRQIYRLQLQEKNVRGIIHDLKSPLNYIYSILDFFELDETNEHKNEQLAIGKSRIKRLSDNVERMLSEIKLIEKKSVTLQRKPYNVENNCREIVSDLQVVYKEKQVTATFAIEPEAQTIYVDSFYFDSCLRNLLDNAIKYSGEFPVIDITAKKQKDKTLISIADNGVGISKKEQRSVFTSFFRSMQHSSIKGHGLGLQSVQQIVKAHNGKITLNSIDGKGSTFTIIIPDN